MAELETMSGDQTITIPADKLVEALLHAKQFEHHYATKESVDNLKDRMVDKFNDLDRRLDEHKVDTDKRFDEFQINMDKRFEQIDKRFEQVDNRFDRLESRFDRLTAWLVGGMTSLALLILGGFGTMAFYLMTHTPS